MSSSLQPKCCVIVGAGIAGLAAAKSLQERGVKAIVLEKAARPGGRMAAQQIGASVFDYGAQFFTVRDSQFAALLDDWREAGVATEWGHGFESAGHDVTADGFPRYRAEPDMRAIAEHLAKRLHIRFQEPATSLVRENGHWLVGAESGQRFEAGAVLLTPPVPEALGFTAAQGIELPAVERAALEAIEYDPCIALLVRLDGPSALPDPGGLRMPSPEILWMADNHRKGISPNGYGVTIHAGPFFSREYFDADDGLVTTLLLGAAHDWLGAKVLDTSLHRWRYSQPVRCYPAQCLSVASPAPLLFAGDAFGAPRVEGAALSGLAAAEVIARAL